MNWRDKKWKYANAAETRKPGYLKRRFERIRREQAQQAKAEHEHKVRSILKRKAA
jgi:hypothetical protein